MNKKEMIRGLNTIIAEEHLCAGGIRILKRIRDALQSQPASMKYITLTKDNEGHWLSVIAADGCEASFFIEGMKHGPIVNSTFLQWAKEEITRQEGGA